MLPLALIGFFLSLALSFILRLPILLNQPNRSHLNHLLEVAKRRRRKAWTNEVFIFKVCSLLIESRQFTITLLIIILIQTSISLQLYTHRRGAMVYKKNRRSKMKRCKSHKCALSLPLNNLFLCTSREIIKKNFTQQISHRKRLVSKLLLNVIYSR